MVWEERFYAEPKDIISIRLTCKKCGSSSTIPMHGHNTVIHNACAYCSTEILSPGSSDCNALFHLLQDLNTLRQRDSKSSCDIHFELPGKLNMLEDE